jgi:hypothetical protein
MSGFVKKNRFVKKRLAGRFPFARFSLKLISSQKGGANPYGPKVTSVASRRKSHRLRARRLQ